MDLNIVLMLVLAFAILNALLLVFVLINQKRAKQHTLDVSSIKSELLKEQADLRHSILNQMYENQTTFSAQQQTNNLQLQQSLLSGFKELTDTQNQNNALNRDAQSKALNEHASQVALQIEKLNNSTEQRLDQMSERVNQKLTDGFEKSIQTFNDILKRLALIDEAQKKISELSTNVVSLQSVLADKRSRGAFGEVQLNSLLDNVLAPDQYHTQYTLSNSKIADAILELPKPTGRIVIDSKFPLEAFQRMTDHTVNSLEQREAAKQFKLDVKKHIKDIADKYIIKNETADSAILFLPAEAIFAEIHAHHNDLVELAWRSRVWLTSPTTLMAVLTTAKAVLKDDATRQQVHIIQQHLIKLSDDFRRFGLRFDQLAKHIDQAARDVEQIHTSAKKITGQFDTIENLQLDDTDPAMLK